MKRLIIDCDPGNGIAGANVDDGLALALALAAPQLSLELVTTVAGNTPSAVGYNVAKDLMARVGRAIPVVQGSTRALHEPDAPWRDVLDNNVHKHHLAHLWQDVRPPQVFQPPALHAADAIGQLICANPGDITLVAIGPLTNVAMALQRYPDMAAAVSQIVIMGGVFALDDYIKDTNFGFDPEAAHQVLTSGANITLVPLDVTTQTLMTHADLDRIASLGTPLAGFICETFRPWIDYSMSTRGLPGCWIHDALVIAWLLDPDLASAAPYHVDVELRAGRTRGKTWRHSLALRLDVGIAAPAGKPVNVLKTVDNHRLLALIERHLGLSTP
ncbi:nucleoside hydrolase [Pseudomonas tolaasii]|uniref:nucleoside hydrolase n=1 Tax=Pseudomonas tolaasii TaxID=29442 RepID=UPI0015A244F6|nr:nucleoside hydrolase [Pseudomonas tolaasii]NWC27253.1 nucleoside hydrolase [Pseudomonas tolaasii]NWC54258.1 nucleoside hydrolase [Pseudomonas tolaasii]NWE61546.1 nucleoside hydrolase [Pseudomonas tolaasii]